MENSLLMERLHLIKGLDPVADAFAATVYSDIVSLAKYNRALFLLIKGVGATGTSTLTVEACSDNTGTGAEAIPFKYRRVANSGDNVGAITQAAAAGFTTTAGSSEMYCVEVDSALCPDGKPWVRLKAVEVVDSPVLGGILVQLGDARYEQASQLSAV